MPFKNPQQMRACFAKQARGDNGTWDCKKWAKKTPKHIRKAAGKTKNESVQFKDILNIIFKIDEEN